jgi:hypothetical protein
MSSEPAVEIPIPERLALASSYEELGASLRTLLRKAS